MRRYAPPIAGRESAVLPVCNMSHCIGLDMVPADFSRRIC